ncbi:MAG: hypothetical protein JJU13_13210 [Balneolaceae bacterium]|nr:hypothetical protein [Balneolaceae bacterium]
MYSKDPIEQIRNNLQNYEEPYRLGAWEEFKRYRQAKNRATQFRWIAAAAAAVLVALSASYLVTDVAVRTSEQITEEQPEQTAHPDPGTDAILQPITPPEEPAVESEFADEEALPEPVPAETIPPEVIVPDSDPSEETWLYSDLLAYKQIPHWEEYTAIRQYTDESDQTLRKLQTTPVLADDDSFRNDRYITESDLSSLKHHTPGLSIGLAYSPLLNFHQSATDWNVGGGLTVDWNFMENLSLSSGLFVAQSQLDFRTDHVRVSETMQPVSSANLEIDFLSLEIPINLQYSMTDRFFISGGITSASFLKEQYTYHYEMQEMSTTMVFIDGEYQPVTQLVTMQETAAQSEPSLSSFNPLAFYNFSFGYSFDEAGNGRFTITIEPFFKMPARSVSTRSVNYSTGGLQLKIAF